jgi:hypothetical protein
VAIETLNDPLVFSGLFLIPIDMDDTVAGDVLKPLGGDLGQLAVVAVERTPEDWKPDGLAAAAFTVSH